MKKPIAWKMRNLTLALVLCACAALSAPVSASGPVGRRWDVYLIHHSHVDIGYTHPQEEVMRLQWQNLETAMDLADETRDFPDDARFRWNPEALWVVETWLAQASEKQKERFLRQVREGSIGLDALFANMLTGLCRPEELMQAMAAKRKLERLTRVPIVSAMTTDVPGASWGLVPALALNRVRYLSMGPNRTARIGFTLKEFGDRPFYWVSASGRERVLCYVHGKGYSWFHTGLKSKNPKNKFTPERIFKYLESLARNGYPYDMVVIRYNIGADNGPPDPNISDLVRKWNQTYPEVRVRLSTTAEAMAEFEKRYGSSLPELQGDFTPYWEDGAASSARETAMARAAGERLAQAQALFALTGENFPSADFRRAWNQVLLFNEHTWGAYNSILAPDSEFARSQWEWKKARAQNADALSRELFARALNSIPAPGSRPQTIEVINTHSWPVSGPVMMNAQGLAGFRVETEQGEPTPSQVLSSGRLFFIAREAPGLSSRKFILKPGPAYAPDEPCRAEPDFLANGRLEVRLDPKTGTIRSLRRASDAAEFINASFPDGFNRYVYVRGRLPELGRWPSRNRVEKMEVTEPGPVLCQVRIRRKAPGSKSLITTVTVYAGLDRVDLENVLERPRQRLPESIHFAFPVNAEDPVVRYDAAWAAAELDKDQLPAACKNYITASRWADVSGPDKGLQLVLVDAPLFEPGEITVDPALRGWLKKTKRNGVIYSYVMNNYWETNYRAFQPGRAELRYSLFPHGGFDPSENMKRAMEVMQPLAAVPSSASFTMPPPPVAVDNPAVLVDSLQPLPDSGGLAIRLYNTSLLPQTAAITFREPCRAERAFDETSGKPAGGRIEFAGQQIKSIICLPGEKER